jgi:hypothetical protein
MNPESELDRYSAALEAFVSAYCFHEEEEEDEQQ